jgi:hypothetical protein
MAENTLPTKVAAGVPAKDLSSAFGFQPTTYKEAFEFATVIAKSALCPKSYTGKPGDIMVAWQMGAELGLPAMQSLQGIAVINGTPSIWGDLGVALCQRSGQLEYLLEDWDEKTQTATARIKRRGYPERIQQFSMADAKRANLSGKQTYQQYPQRMCGWRAKTWAMRGEFADVLRGIAFADEAQDLPESQPAIEMPRAIATLSPATVQANTGEPPPDVQPEDGPGDQPQDTPAADPMDGAVTVVEAKEAGRGSTTKGKPWVRYELKLSDNRVCSTFSSTVFANAQAALSEGAAVKVETETKRSGDTDYLNIVTLERA